MTAYLDAARPPAWCPGCGHPHVLRALDEALAATGLPARRFVLVTDIGCVGLADPYFPSLHTVHALHGRATAVAAGMQWGEPGPRAQALKPVVLVGDGGATIGLLHLVHAAQTDADVTVVVHNNLVYGMTGGQHSGLTPEGFVTTTTPEGNPVPPLDLGRVLDGAGCGFFARTRAPGPDLVGLLAEAIARPGFACVEALELCPTFAARVGGLTGRSLDDLPARLGLPTGVVIRRDARTRRPAPSLADRDPLADAISPTPAWRRLDRTARVVVAGRAGERVQAAARLAATAAAAAGLSVAGRTDNPVTQGRGFSLAEVVLAPGPIAYAGTSSPEDIDLACATAPEGLEELASRGLLRPPALPRRVVLDSRLAVPPGTEPVRRDLRERYGAKSAALGVLAEEIHRAGWWAPEAWAPALATLPAGPREEAAATLRAAGAYVA